MITLDLYRAHVLKILLEGACRHLISLKLPIYVRHYFINNDKSNRPLILFKLGGVSKTFFNIQQVRTIIHNVLDKIAKKSSGIL